MKDERTLNVLGAVKLKFSIYAIILSIISIILKLILNKSFIFFDSLPEIVILIGLLITNITKPVEEVEDERVTANINNHYNRAFKLILPIAIFSYILSVILIIKTNSAIYLSPNLFINSFLFLIFIGVIVLVKNHHIYLNGEFLEKESYFFQVFKVIGVGLVVTIGLIIISFILNAIIPGSKAAFTSLFLMLVFSFFNLSVQYFLYSIYEYNHYHESIDIADGKIPIVTRNMYLYFGIIMFFSLITQAYSIFLTSHLFNPTSVLIEMLMIGQYLNVVNIIYRVTFLLIITYSLKATLLRLKEHSISLIQNLITITNIYAVVLVVRIITNPIINFILRNNATLLNLFSSFNMFINFVIALMYIVILIIRFVYAHRHNFPNYKILIIPIVCSLLSINIPFLNANMIRFFTKQKKIYFLNDYFSLIVLLIILAVNLIIIHKYSKPYEIIVEE